MTTLAKFLQAKEPLFDLALTQLEEHTGKQGVDAALAGEIAAKAANRVKRLGLDANASAEELYEALLKLVSVHDAKLAAALGGSDPSNTTEMIPLLVKFANNLDILKDGFFIKESVAEQMLRRMPPQSMMARLGYSEVGAMLASENLYEIFLALRFAESEDWLREFNAQFASVEPSDFENRKIQLVPFDAIKWGDIAEHFIQKKLHNITNSKEMGAIAVMPMTIKYMPGITLKALPLIIHYFNEIRLYSAYFKLIQSQPKFGEEVADTLNADPAVVTALPGQKVHWRVIQRYFGKLKDESHPEIFQPHLQPEDLHWRKAEEVLYEIDPELEFWRDMDYVAVMKGDEAVTFNLMDVSLSYSNQIPFTDRYLYHFRESLWNEVFARYMGQKTLEDQILTKLGNEVVAPEEIKL